MKTQRVEQTRAEQSSTDRGSSIDCSHTSAWGPASALIHHGKLFLTLHPDCLRIDVSQWSSLSAQTSSHHTQGQDGSGNYYRWAVVDPWSVSLVGQWGEALLEVQVCRCLLWFSVQRLKEAVMFFWRKLIRYYIPSYDCINQWFSAP